MRKSSEGRGDRRRSIPRSTRERACLEDGRRLPWRSLDMWLRANLVLAVALVFAVVQMFASVTGGPRIGDSGAVAGGADPGLSRSVAAQEENDDNTDDDDDNDADCDD